jgi:hypothetical protein
VDFLLKILYKKREFSHISFLKKRKEESTERKELSVDSFKNK